jgi:hypothetical protein
MNGPKMRHSGAPVAPGKRAPEQSLRCERL